METVACDLCGSEEYRVLFSQTDLSHKTTTESFQMVCCNDCGLHYLNPRPTQSEIKRYYSEEYSFFNHQSVVRRIAKDFLMLVINQAYLKKTSFLKRILSRFLLSTLNLTKFKKKLPYLLILHIKSYLEINTPKRILDVGCGSGESVHMYGTSEAIVNLAKKGWDVYGVEPSDKARTILNNKGLSNIYPDLLQTSFEDNFFDVIRMNWTLEHFHSPTLYLEECKRILKDKGKLIVCVPNYDGITYRIFPECVEIPVHLYYYCRDTFIKYCSKLGYDILDYYTFSYVPLFLKSISLMGHSSLHQFFVDNHREAIKLSTFLNLMSAFDLGDDIVFCLSKGVSKNGKALKS